MTASKLFVLRIVSCSYNCLQRIIIFMNCPLKLYKIFENMIAVVALDLSQTCIEKILLIKFLPSCVCKNVILLDYILLSFFH